VTKRYLTSDNRTTGVLIPLPVKEGKPVPGETPGKGDIVR